MGGIEIGDDLGGIEARVLCQSPGHHLEGLSVLPDGVSFYLSLLSLLKKREERKEEKRRERKEKEKEDAEEIHKNKKKNASVWKLVLF